MMLNLLFPLPTSVFSLRKITVQWYSPETGPAWTNKCLNFLLSHNSWTVVIRELWRRICVAIQSTCTVIIDPILLYIKLFASIGCTELVFRWRNNRKSVIQRSNLSVYEYLTGSMWQDLVSVVAVFPNIPPFVSFDTVDLALKTVRLVLKRHVLQNLLSCKTGGVSVCIWFVYMYTEKLGNKEYFKLLAGKMFQCCPKEVKGVPPYDWSNLSDAHTWLAKDAWWSWARFTVLKWYEFKDMTMYFFLQDKQSPIPAAFICRWAIPTECWRL